MEDVLIHHGQSTSLRGMHLATRTRNVYFGFHSNDMSGNAPISENNWYHIVYRADRNGDNTTKTVFLNGVQTATASGTIYYQGTGSNGAISKNVLQYSPNSSRINGYLNHVLFYNRPLSNAEISHLYNYF